MPFSEGSSKRSTGLLGRRVLLVSLWSTIAMLALLSLVSLVKWRQDLNQIEEIVVHRIERDAESTEVISQALEFLREDVGYGRHDAYFLLPPFRFMRPTALQVIRDGGDCAYRARAFIVILRLFDIRARKLALYNDGRPVHAVTEVATEDGPLYIDPLFNFAHVDGEEKPLSLDELGSEEVLRNSIQRVVARGNRMAARYPLDEYQFEDVRTLNWHKNVFTKIGYRTLVAVLGEERAKKFPRPYIAEEPALMVIVLCSGTSVLILVCIVLLRRKDDPTQAAWKTRSAPRSAEVGRTRT